jgi:hypothetical protein
MIRLYIILGVIAAAFWVFTIVDCLVTRPSAVRALPKAAWAFIVLLPVAGGILWFTFGKQRRGTPGAMATGTGAPDDDPEFLRRLGEDADREERIRQLEEQLAELDDDHNDSKD